jgi:hypothetical protein
MDILTTGQSSGAKLASSAVDSLLSSLKLPIKVDALEGNQLRVTINGERVTLPLDKLDAASQRALSAMIGRNTDTQALQKVIGENLKLPIKLQSINAQHLVLSFNQQQLKVPTELLSQQLLAQLSALANNKSSPELFAQINKASGDWVLQLLQKPNSNYELTQLITKQQLAQLLPTPSARPNLNSSQLHHAQLVLEVLANVADKKLTIGGLKLPLKSAMLETLGTDTKHIRSQLHQHQNAFFLKLNTANTANLSLPITDKKTLFQLVQFAVANHKLVQIQTKATATSGAELQLNQLKITAQQSLSGFHNNNQLVKIAGNADTLSLTATVNQVTSLKNIGALKLSTDIFSQLQNAVSLNKVTSKDTTSVLNGFLGSKTPLTVQEKNALQNALRELIPQQQSAKQVIKLLKATGESANPALRPLLTSLAEQLVKTLPDKSQVPSENMVKQLIQPFVSGQAISLQPQVQATNLQQGIEGLVQLLLTAKVTANSQSEIPTSLQQRILQFVANPIVAPNTLPQVLRQLGQSNLSSQLLQQIAGILGSQKLARVSFVDSAQQNNPQFFMSFPLNYEGQTRDLEILIKPQADEQQEQEQESTAKGSWQINLRFDLPELGIIMASAVLAGKRLQLDFYTESQSAVRKIAEFTDTLQQRLAVAGLDVEDISAQQGQIPETLQQKQHSLLYVRA